MKIKIALLLLLSIFIFSNVKSYMNIRANSEQENTLSTDIVDFDIQNISIIVYLVDNDYRVGYLFEGVTPSYMIYDHINGDILLYCYDSHSPWYLYPSSFENFGCLYLGGNLYSYINLQSNGIHMKGEIEVINQDIIIESNPLIADLFFVEIIEPTDLNYEHLFVNNIIESYIITDAWYFERLNANIGINVDNSCQYVAVNMILSYYDTFYDDNIIPDEYIIETDVVNRNNFDMAIESPGGGQLLDAHLKELMVDSDMNNTTFFLYERLLEEFFTEHNYDINQMFEFIGVDDTYWLVGETMTYGYIDVIDALSQDLPVFLGMYPFSYYDNESGEFISIDYGHAVIAYGYYITDIELNGYDNSIYYLCNMGFYDEFHQYKYTKTLMSTLNSGVSEGFVLKPNNNFQHVCSDSYIFSIGDCEIGLCPCDQYLSDKEFYDKYCNFVFNEGYDEFYCKKHNNQHLIYRREHIHNYEYTKINGDIHFVSCTIPGCIYNVQEEHTHSHQINSLHTEHYDICLCGDVTNLAYDFYHITDWDNSHIKICTLCGLRESINDYQCYAISEHYHEYYCELCDLFITEGHELVYDEIDNQKHIRRCIHCDYYEITFHDSWGNVLEYYWNPENNYYDVYCILCGNHHTSHSNKEDE